MRMNRTGAFVACFLLFGCSNAPYVQSDSRGPFDTVQGLYGGNEFSARAPEGEIHYAGEDSAKAQRAVADSKSTTAISAPSKSSAASPSVAAATIEIDANVYGLVFGGSPMPVTPSAEQLLQLDSLSLVVSEAVRLPLQHSILACRRAGERCRFTHS